MEMHDMLKQLCVCLDNVPADKAKSYIDIAKNFGIENYEAPAYNIDLVNTTGVVAIKSIFPKEFNDLFVLNPDKIHSAVEHVTKILMNCPDTVKVINFGCPGVKGKITNLDDQQRFMLLFKVFLNDISYAIYRIREIRNMPELVFCIEPTAAQYGSNMLVSSNAVMNIINNRFDNEKIKMLFDAGNEVTIHRDVPNHVMPDFNKVIEKIGHIHISPTHIGSYLYSEEIDQNKFNNAEYKLIERKIVEAFETNQDNFPYISLESKLCSGHTLKDVEKDLEVFINHMVNAQ